jgi:zinc protease
MRRSLSVLVLLLIADAPGVVGRAAPKAAGVRPQAQTPAALPAVGEILDKYLQAVGGKAALEKVTTRVMKGSFELPATGDTGSIVPGTIEVYMKAPNKRMAATNIPGTGSDRRGFNGKAGWYVDPDEGPQDLSGPDLEAMKGEAEFYREIKLQELSPKMTVEGTTKVGNRQAYVVSAKLTDGSEKLYFDAQTGLLLRDDLPVEIPDEGRTTQQTFFEDYKDVDGVKLPFTIRRLRTDGDSIIKFSEIKNNVPVDDGKFEKPAK